MSRSRVAVVVPLTDRPELTPDEQISFRHLQHFLGEYDRYGVAPRGLRVTLPFTAVRAFNPEWFGSAVAYRKLVLSREFWESFSDYEFILVYQLDALVFSSDLDRWCNLELDYIGAPWLKSMFNRELDTAAGFDRVGNSGFSLRRVSSHLKVLNSDRYSTDPDANWERRFGRRALPVRLANLPRKHLLRLRTFNNVTREVANIRMNADFFWSNRARWFYPDFRVAPVDVGLAFAFEVEPRYCFEQNGQRMPFGCHAWPKYDRKFWEPYLLHGDQGL
jgi:hypothetical protein